MERLANRVLPLPRECLNMLRVFTFFRKALFMPTFDPIQRKLIFKGERMRLRGGRKWEVVVEKT